MKKYIFPALAVLALSSCNDFLDQRPQDFGDEMSYFRTPDDLILSTNQFYSYLPKSRDLWGGMYSEDTNSDNQAKADANALFYEGNKLTPNLAGSTWETCFKQLREINFFIGKAEGNAEAGILDPENVKVRHYIGVGYFFRAYATYELLRNYGDAPILTEMLPDDLTLLISKSERAPRNEVARAILADLDKAIDMMQENAPKAGEVYQDIAYALKARVALYEATWEKYHANTCFVPGNAKWVGKTAHPDFAFKAGSADAEINFFLDQAMSAAQVAADRHPLSDDYRGLFNSYDVNFPGDHEVIFARYYKSGIISHSCSVFLGGGGNCNATRAAVNTYLMDSGLPIYADSNYAGDEITYYEFQGRDNRLQISVRATGSIMTPYTGEDGKVHNDTIYYHRPNILGSGNEKASTGYEIDKYVVKDSKIQNTQYMCTTTVPLIRSAEMMLAYIEACYLRNGNIDGTADAYWRALRRRAGVDEDYHKTIAATDLSKENDLAVWSKGVEVDKTLYNIRRERRCELFAEGLRLDDLKRWRALDNMKNWQPEGINLWDKQWEMWGNGIKTSNAVSQASASKYIRPLQVVAGANAYNGYNFPKPHYLEPIPVTEFAYQGTPVYQNPGWPTKNDKADYTYDCD